MSNSIKNKLIKEIIERYKIIWSLNYFSRLGAWDMNTYMPEEGAKSRGEALGKIEVLSQNLFLDKSFIELIEMAEKEKLNDYEAAIIRILKRDLKYYQKLPADFIEEFAKVKSEAHIAWKKAKEENNFSLFEPQLDKIIKLSRKMTEYLGYEKHPYNTLLDLYEENLTVDEVEKYFAILKPKIIGLLKHIKNSKHYKEEHKLRNESYEADKMRLVNKEILEYLHYNLNHLRLDVSPHPFSVLIGPGDARITTRYEGKDFARAYNSTIHEYGHSLYEIQSHEDLNFTPIAGGRSMIIHESQSRFWENIVGRSKEFLSLMQKSISDLSPEIKEYSLDEIYNYFNSVTPSFIRTEADEVTYHLHIIIRFEIEKALLEGKINTKDLPRIWNEKYKEYLGVTPRNDSEGVLQDIHWSQGNIGYFPTYSFGTALCAMWGDYMQKELGSINNLIKSKEGVRKIQDWLKKHIHQYGSTYTYKDSVKRVTGEEFNPKYLIEYLEEKYKKIY